jgi:sigma-B regulation protein RsbU (phosphoserine phosphatase)
MFKNLKVRKKIVLIVLIAASVSLCFNTVRTYMQMSKIFSHSLQTGVNLGLKASNEMNIAMTEQAKSNLQHFTDLRAREVSGDFKQIKKRVSEIANLLEFSYKNSVAPKGSLPPRVRRDITENETLASDVIFAKYDLAPGISLNEKIKRDLTKVAEYSDLFYAILKNNQFFDGVYMGLENGGFYIVSKHKTSPIFDVRERDWYKAAVDKKDESICTDSYIDIHGIVMVTCAKAFYYPNEQLAGVVAIDVKHSDMIDKMLNNNLINNGSEFLLDRKENYISQDSILNADEVWYEALHDIAIDKYVSKIVQIDSEDHYLFSSKIEENGWAFGLMIPAKTVSLPIEEIKIKIATQIEQAKQSDRTIFSETLMNFISGFILVAILSMVIAIVLSRSITGPLQKLVRQINFMGKGNLNRIELNSKDEFGELSRAFNKMSDNLRNYIKELEYANAQTEHINNELEIARRIQNDLLPRKAEDFNRMENLDFYVRMIAAKEIGGDFYDFFYMDSEKSKVCFIIGDVSGKGIPAAIYMAQTKVLIKTNIMQTQSLALALKNVNAVLSENNEYCMFVTAIALSLDLNSKECIMVNCGHNNPIVSIDGTPYEFLKMNNSMAIGISERSEYEEECLKLSSNDKIYLYTDGATEAMNNKAEFFGKDRLLKCANNNLNLSPKDLDWAIRSEITAFTAGTPQADDTTTLAIRIM